ncbi:MAG TPA: peptidylprolyl isomerase [Acidimicrobiia bacterium]|jgi:cyclophilin family peptidyl-prolyl cis-trans isomerase|nr:peptidylprolyl isomerase [Acidimicrobiia bacterium]
MPAADKRARKKENARAAREQREAALRRKKRTRSTITIGVVVAIFAGVVVLLNVTGSDKKKAAATTTTTTLDRSMKYTATISTNYGPIKLALDVKNAPIAAGHFIDLARKGVYDGSRWHRIIKGFVVQGGAPGGDPLKNYAHSVVGEIPKGKYKLYDVAAAKGKYDPAGTFGSQFFIITGAQGVALSHDYTDFAHMISGLDVVNKLLALQVDGNGDPKGLPGQKATIDKVTISVG